MAVLRSVTLLLVCLAAVRADDPSPCCVPKQFTIKIDQVNNELTNGVVVSVEQHFDMAYDADNELLADILSQYNADTGNYSTTKTIYIFAQKAKYVITEKGCTKEAIGYDFLEMCVPSIATFKSTLRVGLGDYLNNLFQLSTPGQSYDTLVSFLFGDKDCIPYEFAVRRAPPSGSATAPSAGRVSLPFPFNRTRLAADTPLAIRTQYYDYVEGIADPSFWFKPPAECQKQPTSEQKASAKQMAKRLMAQFKSKNFAVL